MTWNYRVAKDRSDFYGIVEVYYDEQGKVRLLNKDAEEVKTFYNTLSAKMWVEIQTDDQYKDLRRVE